MKTNFDRRNNTHKLPIVTPPESVCDLDQTGIVAQTPPDNSVWVLTDSSEVHGNRQRVIILAVNQSVDNRLSNTLAYTDNKLSVLHSPKPRQLHVRVHELTNRRDALTSKVGRLDTVVLALVSRYTSCSHLLFFYTHNCWHFSCSQ